MQQPVLTESTGRFVDVELIEVASGLGFPEGPVAMADGSVVLTEISRSTLSRVTPDGEIEVEGSYLIACDGGRSTVRGLLDIPVEGRSLPVGHMKEWNSAGSLDARAPRAR